MYYYDILLECRRYENVTFLSVGCEKLNLKRQRKTADRETLRQSVRIRINGYNWGHLTELLYNYLCFWRHEKNILRNVGIRTFFDASTFDLNFFFVLLVYSFFFKFGVLLYSHVYCYSRLGSSIFLPRVSDTFWYWRPCNGLDLIRTANHCR